MGLITGCQIKGLVCILKLLEFQEADFKPLKVVEIIVFLSFKFLNFIPKKDLNYQLFSKRY